MHRRSRPLFGASFVRMPDASAARDPPRGRPRHDPARPTTRRLVRDSSSSSSSPRRSRSAHSRRSAVYTSLACEPADTGRGHAGLRAARGIDRPRPDRQSSSPASGSSSAKSSTYDEIPPILLDATTAVEDKTFWENAGFDPVAIISAGLDSLRGRSRGASTITQQLVRACACSTGDLRPGPGPDRRAQAQGDHPVDPADPALRGRPGKQDDHHGLPEPELLRQPELRREGGRPLVLRRKELSELTPAEAATLARCRSRRRTTTSCATRSRSAIEPGEKEGECPRQEPARGARRHDGRGAPEPDPDPHGRRRPDADVRTASTPLKSCSPPAMSRSCSRRRRTERWQAPQFVWRVRDELATKLCGEDADVPGARSRRPAHHHHARSRRPEDRREVGQGGGRRAVPGQPAAGGQGASASSTRTGCATSPTSGCATAPSSRWTTRPAS